MEDAGPGPAISPAGTGRLAHVLQ